MTAQPPPVASAQLELIDVHQSYGGQAVVQGVSFSLAPGRIACLLGPSGCGKTTVLRCIAGFERIAAGRILQRGQLMADAHHAVATEHRRIGMVFQDYALFPHLSVAANIGFGLRRQPRAARRARVEAMLALVGLGGQGKCYPHELSGGQQQRVALARALAPEPELILLDEPFSNLDVDLRERLSREVRQILKDAGSTALMVTHDQHEAFAVADEIGVMHHGRIAQWADAYQLYHEPSDRFVADFVGQGVFVRGTVRSASSIEMELGTLHARHAHGFATGAAVDVLLRPDDVVHDDASRTRAEVLHKAFRGADILYTLRLAGGLTQVLSLVPSHHNHAVGEAIGIRLDVDHVVAFAAR